MQSFLSTELWQSEPIAKEIAMMFLFKIMVSSGYVAFSKYRSKITKMIDNTVNISEKFSNEDNLPC